MSLDRVFLAWNSLQCSKIHFLFNEAYIYVANWLKWHYKLQHLFCGALYNQWKCKKCAVPLKILLIFLYHLCLIILLDVLFNCNIIQNRIWTSSRWCNFPLTWLTTFPVTYLLLQGLQTKTADFKTWLLSLLKPHPACYHT
jgi:hypothetical protein